MTVSEFNVLPLKSHSLLSEKLSKSKNDEPKNNFPENEKSCCFLLLIQKADKVMSHNQKEFLKRTNYKSKKYWPMLLNKVQHNRDALSL